MYGSSPKYGPRPCTICCAPFLLVFAGQQVRILGENFTLEDEEDSKIGQVCWSD